MYDIWLLKIETDTLAVMEHNTYTIEKQVNSVIISGPLLLSECYNYRIFDIMGREINILDPVPGVYFIEVDGKIRQKIIKVR